MLKETAGKRSAGFAICVAGLALLGGCGTPDEGFRDDVSWTGTRSSSPTYYSVVAHRGDTMSTVASRYNTSAEDLSRMNGRPASAALRPGDVLHVPATGETRHAVLREATNEHAPYAPPTQKDRRIAAIDPAIAPRPISPRDRIVVRHEPPIGAAIAPRERPGTTAPVAAPVIQSGQRLSANAGGGEFCSPVTGRVILGFGDTGNGQRNDGINIAAAAGTPIHAAADGTVSYAGNELKGYGNLILIKHDDGIVTAYAHANSIGVARGQRVAKGDVIGTVGQTGDVDQPQLHFEVRQGMKPIDPRPLLMASAS